MENYAYNTGFAPVGVQGESLGSQMAAVTGIGGPSMLVAPKPLPKKVPSPVRETGDGPVLGALGIADGVGQGVWGAEFGLPILGWLLRNSIGRLPYVGTHFNNYVGAISSAPIKALQHTRVGDMGQLGDNFKRARATYALDPEMRAAGGEKFERWKVELGPLKAFEPTAAATANTGAAFGEGAVQRWAASSAHANAKQLTNHLDSLKHALDTKSTASWLDWGRKQIGMKPLTAAQATLPAEYNTLAAAIDAMKTYAAQPAHLQDMSALQAHYGEIEKSIAALQMPGKEVVNSAIKATLGTHLQELGGTMRSLGGNLNTARSNETTLKAAGSMIKNASMFDVAFKGGLGLGTAYYIGKAGTGAWDSISKLKEATKDLTGREPSTLEILFSANSLPPILREARGNMIARLIPETVAGFASAGLNIMFMKRHMGGKEQALMFGGMMTQMAAHNLTPAENFLNAYITAKDMQKAGQPVPQELYLELINASSVDARAAGGSGNRLVQTIAADYAKEQTPVAEMLKEIGAKEPYMKRAAKAAEQLKAADAAKHVAPAHKEEIGAKPEVNVHAADKPAKISLSDAAHQGKIGHAVQHEMGGA